jgi:hypothetical protein
VLEQRLRETGSVTSAAHMNIGGPQAEQTPANEDAMTAGAEQESWRSSRDIGRELGLSHLRVGEQLHPYH